MGLLNRGLYSPREAGRLVGVETRAVKRWAFGYTRGGTFYDPAIPTSLPPLDDSQALTFAELVELLVIDAFLEAGASWSLVRSAFHTASELLEREHPFATKGWFVDPGGIYKDLGEEEDEELLVEMSKFGQVASEKVLGVYLEQIEFDWRDLARRWYPRGRDGPVVLDPHVEFGSPVVAGTRVETEVLWQLAEGGEPIAVVADAFDLSPEDVESAVAFERSTREAA